MDGWRRMGALVVALHKRRKAEAKRQKLHKILYFTSKSYWCSEVAMEVFEFHPAGTVPATGPQGTHGALGHRPCTLTPGDAWAPVHDRRKA